MGATDYEPRVVMQLAERLRRFTADLLYDARDYATHARRAEIDVPDARLAVQERQASLMLSAPQTDEMLELADEMNRRPLPRIPEQWGVRLPAEPFCLTAPPVSLVPGDELLARGKTGKRGSHQLEGAAADSDPTKKSRRVHKQAEKPLPIRILSTMTADGQQ
eukprot:TRINITY_DN602_c0_g1_i5.p1 TRINITY_DN602_c0_g1~~TRINITY_DN602_c0_g1_i5.p1  ORF type:complete len:163 (+),score=53.90 TRINITY_DN602_c0_g1_i5:570-1058(+)